MIETLGFRHIAIHRGEYAVSKDGMKMFGIMELETQFAGCRFAIGICDAHDKSRRLAMTMGYRVFVCENRLAEELCPHLDDLLVNLARTEGARGTSVLDSISIQIAEKICVYFKGRA